MRRLWLIFVNEAERARNAYDISSLHAKFVE
jgi:hypothetical protein